VLRPVTVGSHEPQGQGTAPLASTLFGEEEKLDLKSCQAWPLSKNPRSVEGF